MGSLEQLWNGISPCMEPGVGDCVVWWDAWAAVGTILAVFTAIFGPAIQRRFILRKKANAVFAATYYSDTLKAKIFLDGLIERYPIAAQTDDATLVEAKLKNSAEERQRFEESAAKLRCLADREVDGSKWPAVDLDLILAVAHAVQSAKEIVQMGQRINSSSAENRNWETMNPLYRDTMNDSLEDIAFADTLLETVTEFPAATRKRRRDRWKRLNDGWRNFLGWLRNFLGWLRSFLGWLRNLLGQSPRE
ncbi:hypothetical protein I5U56_02815 [Stenotrophomonas maltophilia]|nr:hypothetical protein [Stenotrophomonas maltophilia]